MNSFVPKARTKLLALAVAACFSSNAQALPVAPVVVNGTAGFSQNGNVMTVTNSNGAVINWNTFSIGAGETTRFIQPSASSAVLNRVLANDPSVIFGSLSSNGQVWLVNPAGIFVGASGRIDVAGFVASTLNVTNADFLANKLNFGNTPGAGNVVNQGQITTPQGGSVYLVGANVSNEGIITTPKGETILAAGATVSLIDSATPGVKVEITGAAGNATNLGTITAEAGRIGIAGVLVRNSGTLNASSVVSEGGRVFLKASKDAYVDGAGRIVTTGTKGGSIDVLGDRVAVMDNASLDASGELGGGKIRVGGDYQGKNPDVQNAFITYFGRNASLNVNATKVGDGGTAIVWADGRTEAYGTIFARGGEGGGDGGFVEVSGKQSLLYRGFADRRAPNGKAGTLLLDPSEIQIDVAEWATYDANLDGGDVVVQTSGSGNGDISFLAGYTLTYGGNLSLLAHNDITTNGFTLTGAGGDVTLVAGWTGASTTAPATGTNGDITGYGSFVTHGGNFKALAAGAIELGDISTFRAIQNGLPAGNVVISGASIYGGDIDARGTANNQRSSGVGGAGGNGGNVTLTTTSMSGGITIASITASGGTGFDGSGSGSGGRGGNGGTITVTAGASAVVNIGDIIVYGEEGGIGGDDAGTGGDGGNGGQVIISAGGSITLSDVDASGGHGGDGGSSGESDAGGNGGKGGNGSAKVQLTGGAITINGNVLASGGNGGTGGNAGSGGGHGGHGGGGGKGGEVIMSGTTISITGNIRVAGGAGNSGGIGVDGGHGGDGGDGGDGGIVRITSTGAMSINLISADGGGGDDGNDGGSGVSGTSDGGAGGNGGHGGAGGTVELTAGTTVTIGSDIYAEGGDGSSGESGGLGFGTGQGGTGGHGGYGGMGGIVKIQAADLSTLAVSTIYVTGGDGNNGRQGGDAASGSAGNGGNGGAAGRGGKVTLTATSTMVTSLPVIRADGGEGGNGGDGGDASLTGGIAGNGGAGGAAGNGGEVQVDAKAGIAITSGTITISAEGGDNSSNNGFGGDGGINQSLVRGAGGGGGAGGTGGSIILSGTGTVMLTGGTLSLWAGEGDGGNGGSGGVAGADAADGANGSKIIVASTDLTKGGTFFNGAGDLALVAGGTLSITQGFTTDADLTLVAPTVTVYGAAVTTPTGYDLSVVAKDLTLTSASLYGGYDFVGVVGGDITLNNASYIKAGNDIDLVLAGSSSKLSINTGVDGASYLWAISPYTISLSFPLLSSGGVLIDGVETFTTLPGGSGLFVGSGMTPATAGAGLSISYQPKVALGSTDTITSNLERAFGMEDPEEFSSGSDFMSGEKKLSGYTTGGEEDEFGEDESGNRKPRGKKTVGTCS